MLGSESIVSESLSGKRELNKRSPKSSAKDSAFPSRVFLNGRS
jgi:hypothetical protein